MHCVVYEFYVNSKKKKKDNLSQKNKNTKINKH